MAFINYIHISSLFLCLHGYFQLHNTIVPNNLNDRNCLYTIETADIERTSQLISYCMRDNLSTLDNSHKQCHENGNYTFAELKSRSIRSSDLFDWNAPIDTINSYEKYFLENNFFLSTTIFCNCTENWFGPFCQYEIVDPETPLDSERPSLLSIIREQLDVKSPLRDYFEVLDDISLLTCYQGLQCHSSICLDWREICNGIYNCEHGEDEPEECFLLELNQCQSDEFRCQSGLCISKIFLVDTDNECMDQSDEIRSVYNNDYSNCYQVSSFICDIRICPLGTFSCGDGECVPFSIDSLSCANGRDLFLREKLYRPSSINTNLTMDCWLFLVCSLDISTREFLAHLNFKCWKYKIDYKTSCPLLFEFETHENFLYPFARFFYDQRRDSSFIRQLPTYICFNQSYCQNFPLIDSIFIHNFTCFHPEQLTDWYPDRLLVLQRIFSSCHFPHALATEEENQLFFCNRTRKYISKERINDGIVDCYYSEDEFEETNPQIKLKLNFTSLLECLHEMNWTLRVITNDNDCLEKSDTWRLTRCENGYVGCEIYRKLYSNSIYYAFNENCNGEQKLIIPIENETDETDCEQWSRYRLCDGIWDLNNGEDELHCSLTLSFYIRQTILKCNRNEHYCSFQNGTMGCLETKYAGDNYCHCLGCTDERRTKMSCRQQIFQCMNGGGCISTSNLCDQSSQCWTNDDELVCPWSMNITISGWDLMFYCKNGTAISRELHCDEKIDCLPDAEDEWFCDLNAKKLHYSLLDHIQEHPEKKLENSRKEVKISEEILVRKKRISLIRNDILFHWYCNRGLIVNNRLDNNLQCLCPSNYYGLRCEYQSERILLTIRMDIPISLKRSENEQHFIRLVICLMFNETCLSYEHFLHKRSTKYSFYLNYPRPPPKPHGQWSVRFDAYLIDQIHVEYKASWFYNVQFSFLPVNRLALYLILNNPKSCNTLNCIHGHCQRYLNFPYRSFCHCEQHWSGHRCDQNQVCPCVAGGKCLLHSSRSFCVCPLGRFGIDCQGWFNSCKTNYCLNNGTCIPLDERLEIKHQCLCPNGYSGIRCERIQNQIRIQFSPKVLLNYHLKSHAMLIHILRLENEISTILFSQHRFFITHLSSDQSLQIFYDELMRDPLFVIIQIHVEQNRMDYYIAVITKDPSKNISTIISLTDRCFHVDQLIENQTIQQFSLIRKVKYYHSICHLKMNFKYFIDDNYLCFCDMYRQLDCAIFYRDSTECLINYCQNNGQCIQNNIDGVWDFRCICQSCTFGSLCQLKTSEFTLSLDLMLGRDILENTSINQQSFLVKITMSVLLLMLIFGLIFNTLSFLTLKQSKVQQFGCGVYLFCLPFIGQFGLVILTGRYFYLLFTQIYHVQYRTLTYWSCLSLEYFLHVCPILFDWLITFVALERLVYIIQGISFNKVKSVIWAKRLIIILTTIILVSSWYQFVSYQLIDDPRGETHHTWCVVIYRWSWIKSYRLIMNLFHLIFPCIIQLLSTIILLHKSTKLKQNLARKQEKKNYFKHLKQQLPLYGIPMISIILSMIRLIFSITLVCIVHLWQKYIYLMAYFISFMPLMATFPIFVLPAKIYRDEFKNTMKIFTQKFIKKQSK